MQSENPYEPPAVEEVAASLLQSTSLELASLSQRFLGAFIDGLIFTAFNFLCGYALYLAGFIRSFDDYDNLGILGATLLSFVSFAFHISINWKFLSTSGQTIGKKMAKTRIVTLDGRLPLMVDLVFKREAFFTFIVEIPVVGLYLSLIDILFIFGRQRRCIHDLIAGTRVIKAHP